MIFRFRFIADIVEGQTQQVPMVPIPFGKRRERVIAPAGIDGYTSFSQLQKKLVRSNLTEKQCNRQDRTFYIKAGNTGLTLKKQLFNKEKSILLILAQTIESSNIR